MKEIFMIATMFLFGLLIFTESVPAQHGYRIEKRIDFRRNETATAKGTIPNILEGHDYLLTAEKGQTLTVGLFSARKDVVFFIVRPNGENLSDETELRSWSGELPEAGEYHIIINTIEKGAARYALELTVD